VAEASKQDNTTDAVLRVISTASDEAYSSFLERLNEPALFSSNDAVKSAVRAAAVEALGSADSDIADFALGFGEVIVDRGESGFLHAVAQRPAVEDGDPVLVEERLRALFESRTVRLGSELLNVSRRQERVVARVSIDTHLRSVSMPPDGMPAAFLVATELRVDYWPDSSAERESSVDYALDIVDLKELQRQVNSALEQHEKLADFMTAFGLSVVEPVDPSEDADGY
jgi:hypothetical protein